jgi:hypothetical protein
MAGTLVANTINTDTGLFSTNNAYSGIAKAWLCYNGGTAIRNSFNISSVTVNGTGDYTINFTTAMSSAAYSLVGTSSVFSVGTGAATVVELYDAAGGGTDPTTSAARIYVHRSAVGAVTSSYVNIIVLGA